MTMCFELTSISFDDTELHGLWFQHEDAQGTALHIHGTWGNFYANPFIAPTGQLYRRHGLNFLTANFPGHDETAISERFADFTPALDSWLDATCPGGAILLQGHSLGALKALHYMQDPQARNRDRVTGLVLFAPFDLVAFYSGGDTSKVDAHLAMAKKLRASHGDSVLVPEEIFDMWQISVMTYLELATPGSASDLFPSRNFLEGSPIHSLRVQTFIAVGSEDFAAFPSAEEVIRMTTGADQVQGILLEGAPHNFAGHVDRLVAYLDGWMETHWKEEA